MIEIVQMFVLPSVPKNFDICAEDIIVTDDAIKHIARIFVKVQYTKTDHLQV